MDVTDAYKLMRENREKNKNDLERFVRAQEHSYPLALSEIRSGRKRSHWMWYIFPQLRGLGASFKSDAYGIADLDEAKRYLAHPLLGARVIEISTELTRLECSDPIAVMGCPDDLKLCSSMTLFSEIPDAPPVFTAVLDKFFGGIKDPCTLKILNGEPPFDL